MRAYFRKIVRRAKQTKKNGQGMVEFALILPVLLLSLFVMIELARVLHAWLAVENGARIGVRAAVTGEYDPTNCNSGFTDDECDALGDELEARLESIHQASWAGSTSIVRVAEGSVTSIDSSYFSVTVCDPEQVVGPLSTFGETICPGGEDPGDPGDRVTVVVEFNHPLFLPGLSNIWPQLRLTASREAIVETFRDPTLAGAPPTVELPDTPIPNTPPPTNTPLPGPECSSAMVKNNKLRPVTGGSSRYKRVSMTLRDWNEEDAYISYIELIFPTAQSMEIDRIRFRPISGQATGESNMTNGDHPAPSWSNSFSAPNGFWVSPTPGKYSHILVYFNFTGSQIPAGTYKLEVHIEWPGFPGPPCVISETLNLPDFTPTPNTSGPSDTDVPDDLPPTNTPGSGGATNTPGVPPD